MRSVLLSTTFFLLLSTILMAQPSNDNCDGLIDLGPVPACPDEIFTNVDATASDIGFGNAPSCFNGGTTQNDVWFSFQTTSELFDVSVFISGVLNGPNGTLLSNPQVALYRGSCQVDGLAEIACISAPNGDALVRLDLLGLSPNETYFIRVNDYSATATPNWGDFQICVDEFVPEVIMGESESTTSCFGTLFDSGGPDGDYTNGENLTFTICPNEAHFCINIDIIDFAIEQGFDQLNFYAGTDVNAPLIARATGSNNGEFPIQVSSSCVTIQFTSDGSTTLEGFELTWQCTPLACDGSTVNNPTVINSIPYNSSGETTCDGAATFVASPCNNDAFLGGPETVFVYESPGGVCAQVQVTNAATGTGVIVLDGPPDDANSTCVGQSTNGMIGSANFQTPGTYYIVVANPSGCTNFDLSLTESDCQLSSSLADALCNPLNGCIEDNGVPSVFNFEDGFQDIDVTTDINGGCWLGFGAEPDFIWFTIQSQAEGPFGFVLESADNPSDIDFNVWGPFTEDEVCENQADVINFIETNQPIRSSWSGGADPTGLIDIHPVTGIDVTDEYDCGAGGGAGGDDFVSLINTQPGEVYVVLINDWGNNIGDAGISVDWGPSDPNVLAPFPVVLAMGGDTAICAGQPVQLLIEAPVDNIQWFGDTATLSCTFCADPIATPTETTIYKAVVSAVCYSDTIEVTVSVFDVDAGPDLTVCRNQEFDIEAGSDFPNATYNWEAPDEVTLSCTDCSTPTVTASTPGTYTISVTLNGPDCTVSDEMTITVLPNDAPEFDIIDDVQICEEDQINLGGPATPGVVYTWTSDPVGFVSAESNPQAMPDSTTTYFLSVVGGTCPLPILDSVLVTVFDNPDIAISSDVMVCQGDTITLGNTTIEDDVTYQWEGPADILDATDPNTQAVPQSDGTYTLTANRGVCVTTESFEAGIVEIAIDVTPEDTVMICKGEVVDLQATVVPDDATVTWAPNDGSLSSNTGTNVTASPEFGTTYTATVEVEGCVRTDRLTILVDSLPIMLDIMPADTMICQGEIVVLTSETYEPSDFPNIEFQWMPTIGAQSQDTLFNYVVQPDTTVEYIRVTSSGLCLERDTAVVNVTPVMAISVSPSDTTICPGNPVELTVIFDGELEEITWEPTEGLSCTDCLDPVATPGATTSYTVTAEFMGCPVSASTNITVLPPPQVALNPNTTICLGDAIQLNLSSDALSDYSWTSPDDPTFSSSDPLLTVSPDETTTYELEATNSCGTFDFSITVQVVLEPTLMVDDLNFDGCEGDVVNLSASSDAESFVTQTFTWTYDGNTQNGESISLEGLTGTTQITFTYTYGTDQQACGEITANGTITMSPAPQLDVPDQIDLCLGESAVLNNNPDFELTSYTWSAPGFNSTDPAPVVTPTETTTYTVIAETPGCPALEESVTVRVIPEPTLMIDDLNINGCVGDPINLNASSDAEDFVSEVYTWEYGGNTQNGESISIEGLTDTTSIIFTYTYGTAEQVCGVIVESGTIIMAPAPQLDVPDQVDLCLGESAVLNNNPDFVLTTYTWTAPGFSSNDPAPVVTPTETTTYSVVAETLGCPPLEESVTVTVTPEVNMTLGPDFEVGMNVPFQLEPIISPAGNFPQTFDWDHLQGDDNDAILNIDSISQTTTFILDYTYGIGCGVAVDSVTVTLVDYDIPNVFTPNNDGVNDRFRVVHSGMIDVKLFKVFNRWGQLVFESSNNDGWDGRQNGNLSPSDVYVYHIIFDLGGNEFNRSGDLTLLR